MSRSRARARRVAGMGVVALLAGFAASYAPPAADAAITTFALSPRSGPPGTVVHVSGTGCTPGLLGSPQSDFVEVSAPTFKVTVRLPVSASGAWRGTFTVPPNVALPSTVTATCVAGSVPSLTTIYTPRSFMVTSPAATTTPTTKPHTTHSTPTTRPKPPTEGTVVVPGHPSVTGAPTGNPHAPNDSSGGDGNRSAGGSPGAPTHRHAVGKTAHGATADPATLQQAVLGSLTPSDRDDGLGWLGGLLLVALLIAASGAALLIWRARLAREAAVADDEAA